MKLPRIKGKQLRYMVVMLACVGVIVSFFALVAPRPKVEAK